MAFQDAAFQNDVTGGTAGFQVSAGAPGGPVQHLLQCMGCGLEVLLVLNFMASVAW